MAKNGGPAFPSVSADGRDEHVGMDLRDYFASDVAGDLAVVISDNGRLADEDSARRTASFAYMVADAMLAERDK